MESVGCYFRHGNYVPEVLSVAAMRPRGNCSSLDLVSQYMCPDQLKCLLFYCVRVRLTTIFS